MCIEDGRTTEATIVDHIVPLVLGGSDEDSNTRNLCDDHNRQVTAEQFGFIQARGIDADGRPSSPHHAWNKLDGGGGSKA